VYRVSWGVESAVDGHQSVGEFAFAGGVAGEWVGGDEPTARDQEPWANAAAAWLLFVGWGIAAGAALVTSRLPPADRAAVPRGAATWITVVTDVRPHTGEPGAFTFFLPGSSMWFDVAIDERGRLLRQRLVNPGHDIRYRFTYPE
jgi:hypothetical protein